MLRPFCLPAAAGEECALLVAARVKYLAFLPDAHAVQLTFWPKNSFKSMDARERFSLKMVPLSINTSDRPLHKLRIKILRQAVKCTTQVTSPYTTMAVTGRYHCSRFVASSAAIEPVVTAFR